MGATMPCPFNTDVAFVNVDELSVIPGLVLTCQRPLNTELSLWLIRRENTLPQLWTRRQ